MDVKSLIAAASGQQKRSKSTRVFSNPMILKTKTVVVPFTYSFVSAMVSAFFILIW